MQSSMVSMPSPARTNVSGLQAPVRPATTEGRLKIPLPITPLTMAAVKSHRPMARTSPGGGDARVPGLASAISRGSIIRCYARRLSSAGGVMALRRRVGPVLALAALAAAASSAAVSSPRAPGRRSENVVLITTDGLRWQEVFGGADESLLTEEAGVADPAALKQEFDRETPPARREALLPFLWRVIARQGQLYGNVP